MGEWKPGRKTCGVPGLAWMGALVLVLVAANVHAEATDQPTTNPARQRKTEPALALPPVNFSNPRREYQTRQIRQWKVLVESQLPSENPELAKRAMAKLDRQLGQIFAVLPEHSHADLNKLTLFLMYGPLARNGGRDNGLEYFQRVAPQHNKDLDPQFAELSAVYFVGGYHFPFTKDELHDYDPDGFRMIKKVWQIGESRSPATQHDAPPASSEETVAT